MRNIFSNEVAKSEKKKKKKQAAKSLQFSYIVPDKLKCHNAADLKYKHTWLAFSP